MKETWKEFVEKKGLKKWFQRDNLIILVLSGVLLLIIALPTKDTKSNSSAESQAKTEMPKLTENQTIQSAPAAGTDTQLTGDEYTEHLEQRLKQILAGVDGVGKVNVMITLQSSEELVVEKDQPLSRSNTTETDSQGGNRSIYQTDSREETVYRTTGSDSEPYVIKTLTPKVEGVFVVAQGAGTGEVSKNITEAVQALFGIEAHKIKVVKME